MARPRNPRIEKFGARIKWCTENLDTDARLARFIDTPKLVYNTYCDAVENGVFSTGGKRPLSDRTWRAATNEDVVALEIIDWICTLYPDMKPEHLAVKSFKRFIELGGPIVEARSRWDDAIELFAKDRVEVSRRAKKFYESVDESDRDFPLILGDRRWLRTYPLELTESISTAEASFPLPGENFEPLRLDGLSADYVSYKGTKTYRTRKLVKKEPQHNGEIFCVDEALFDSGGFRGFKYFLSHYYDYINTSEILGAELCDFLLRKPNRQFPDRFEFRKTPGDALNFRNRATYPGINCLSIFQNYGEKSTKGRSGLKRGDYFLLHKRDETQLQAQNVVHVLPAGGHQAFAAGAQEQDTPIRRTVIREFLEELFDKECLYKQVNTWGDYLSIPEVDALHRIFFSGSNPAARIFLFGFGLDPVTLKPEVLCGIVVDWELATKYNPSLKLKYNWEVQDAASKATRHNWVPVDVNSLRAQAKGGQQSINGKMLGVLPAGQACMEYAADHLVSLLED
ncbi:MAG: hypothetical protein AAF351_00010 [Pseudomonadota bacterium]